MGIFVQEVCSEMPFFGFFEVDLLSIFMCPINSIFYVLHGFQKMKKENTNLTGWDKCESGLRARMGGFSVEGRHWSLVLGGATCKLIIE